MFHEKQYEKIIQPKMKQNKVNYTEIQFPVVNQQSKEHAAMAKAIAQTYSSSAYQKYTQNALNQKKSPHQIVNELHLSSKKLDARYHSAKNHQIKNPYHIKQTPTVFVDGRELKKVENLKDYLI